jgi:phage FluMu gp28-like protein
MSAEPLEFKNPRLITEAEWKKFRLERMALSPAELESVGGVDGVLLAYQKKLLSTTALYRVTICEKSRRTGATWAVAADAVLTSAAERSARGMDSFYIGYNLEMAREFIDTCAEWAKTFNQAAAEVEEFLFEEEPDKSIKAFRIRFASGFQIIALPSRPRSLRGMQGYVIIDEAAFHDDLKELMKAAIALLIWGGRVLVISTHNGEGNPFNTLVKAARGGNGYGLVRFDFDDALHDGLYRRVCLRTGEEWSVEREAAWRAGVISDYGDAADEELFCIPSEGDGAFLPAPLIEARAKQGIPVLRIKRPDEFKLWPQHLRERDIREWCERELLPLLKLCDPTLSHFLGGDYGRISDLTVLWPLAVTKTLKRVTPFVVEMRNLPFDAQRQILKFICDRLPRFAASKHDATGLGMSTAEFAVQQYGELRTEAVMLNVPWYRENGQPLKTAFEDDWIEIPADADIASDLRLLVVKNGVPQVPALKSGVNKDRHGDAAVALMLAYAATRAEVALYDYESAATLRESLRGEDRADAEDVNLPHEGLW